MKILPLATLLLFLLGLSLQTAIAQAQACTISIDFDADGTPDGVTTNTYDANGNLLTESTDFDGDGTPDGVTTNTYDANGNLLTVSRDTDTDGTPDDITTYTYDAAGNLLTESQDYEADGTPDYIETYTYDANGNILTESYDRNGDGTPDEIFTYTYDANGNLLTQSEDTDGDGTPDDIETYTYDANGNLLTESEDTDGDGMTDAITTYTYDMNGNILTESFDYDADGTPDDVFTITYTYDANGNLLTESVDDGDGIPDVITTYTYDANGNILTESVKNDGDGINIIITKTYDANGNILTESNDSDGDGTPDQIFTYTYGNCVAPSCTADAGELGNSQNAASLSICAGTDNGVLFEKSGASMDEFAFLLVPTNAVVPPIIAHNSTGDFDLTTLAAGNYMVYGLSYASSNSPSTIAAYLMGKSLSDIQSDDAGTTFCLDLSNTTVTGETNSITINANPSANLTVTETSGGINNDGIVENGDPFTLTASGGSTYQFFIDKNNNGTFEAASDTNLGTSNPLNATAGSTNFPVKMTTKVSMIATSSAGCTSTAATQDVQVLCSAFSAALNITETSGSTNNDGIVENGDPFTLTASGGSTYQFFIDQNNNGTFESASDTNLGTSNPLNATAGSTNFPVNMTTKVSVIATDNSGCVSTVATQDIEVLNTVNINAAVVNTCTKPYTANFSPVANAVAYRVEIVVPAPFGRTIIQTIGMPPLSSTINIPNRLIGQMVSIRIAPIFVDPNTGQQVVGMFSSPRNFTLGCNPNPANGSGIEGRSEEIVEEMQFQIAPNPVQADLQIRLEQAQVQRIQLQILDVTGRSLRRIEQQSEIGENQWTISISELPSGLYYLQVRSAKGVEVLGFVKE